jgi:ATP-dependent Clp protease ATP-binding subunit ClpA
MAMNDDTLVTSARFAGFTPQARAVVILACEEARALRHDQVLAGHVVLGLLREPSTFAAELLTAAGVDLEQVRSQLRPRATQPSQAPVAPIAFDASATQVFSAARRLADQDDHGRVGSEHLLMALLASTDAGVQRALEGRVDPDLVEQSVAHIREQADLPSTCDTSALAVTLRDRAASCDEEPVKALLARAEEEAVDAGRSGLRSGDLLLALQSGLPDPEAARALFSLRIQRAELETALAALRSEARD